MLNDVSGLSGLMEILSWARPHDSETELRFCREYLDKVPGMQADGFGNRFLRIGDLPVMWSCHVDTVAAKGGIQFLSFDHQTGIISLAAGKPGMSLGADDGAGMWIMLNMIAARRPGLYVFHRGEECGCLGSTWIARNNPGFLDGLQAAVAFDRGHTCDVITHQTFGRTCSDAFAESIAAALNGLEPSFRYEPDDTGVYTDTNEYAGVIPECSNLSVGYQGQHGPRETLDAHHCLRLLTAMLKLDASTLVIERDPTVEDDEPWARWGGYCQPASRKQQCGKWEELILDYPEVAASLLKELGYTYREFENACWDHEVGSSGWRPLSAA